MGRKATTAELRALRRGGQEHVGQIQSTNCGADCRHGALGRQSRAASLAEAATNVVAGYLVALLAQQAVLPLFAVHLSIAAHAWIAAIFTLLSLMRSYLLRRLFDHFDHVRREEVRARQERLRQAYARGRP